MKLRRKKKGDMARALAKAAQASWSSRLMEGRKRRPGKRLHGGLTWGDNWIKSPSNWRDFPPLSLSVNLRTCSPFFSGKMKTLLDGVILQEACKTSLFYIIYSFFVGGHHSSPGKRKHGVGKKHRLLTKAKMLDTLLFSPFVSAE